MRNLYEQKKVVIPIIWTFVMALIAGLIFIVFYLNYFIIDASIFGFKAYDFHDVTRTFEYDEIDEGEFMTHIPAGSKILVKNYDGENDPLVKNDLFAYYVTENTVNTIITQVFIDKVVDEETGIATYYSHNVDDMEINEYTIDSGKILGKHVTSIKVLGTISKYLTSSTIVAIASFAGISIFLIGIPILIAILQARRNKLGSPFPEGVNIERLSTENLYIYESLAAFIRSSGMKLKPGFDCDLAYIGRYLFGILHCTNGHMYFNINKNFQRYDNRVDRSGYICIPHAANLEKAKQRINSMYRACFLDIAHNERNRAMQAQSKARRRG